MLEQFSSWNPSKRSLFARSTGLAIKIAWNSRSFGSLLASSITDYETGISCTGCTKKRNFSTSSSFAVQISGKPKTAAATIRSSKKIRSANSALESGQCVPSYASFEHLVFCITWKFPVHRPPLARAWCLWSPSAKSQISDTQVFFAADSVQDFDVLKQEISVLTGISATVGTEASRACCVRQSQLCIKYSRSSFCSR